MEKNLVDSNEHRAPTHTDLLTLNPSLLLQVAEADRATIATIGKAMLEYAVHSIGEQKTHGIVEALPDKPYNRIVVFYPSNFIFMTKTHIFPILEKDPGALETPKTEYIIDIWTESRKTALCLVCKVLKKRSDSVPPVVAPTQTSVLLGNRPQPSTTFLYGEDVFDARGVYIRPATKKRKLEEEEASVYSK